MDKIDKIIDKAIGVAAAGVLVANEAAGLGLSEGMRDFLFLVVGVSLPQVGAMLRKGRVKPKS